VLKKDDVLVKKRLNSMKNAEKGLKNPKVSHFDPPLGWFRATVSLFAR